MTMAFLRNTWYVAAWDNEVPADRPLRRVLLNEPVVLFRDAAGTVQALFDRCPHRFAPLSMGRIVGDRIQCAYHGLEFDGRGACGRNPHGNGAIPRTAQVRAYPVVERHSLVWIWMGDPALADPEAIPVFRSLDASKRHVAKDYLLARAHYQLEVDNILDLSHIEFLHPGTLGSDAVNQSQTEVVQQGNTVYSNRLTRNERLMPSLEARYGVPAGQRVDRWLDVRWDAPGVMELWVGYAPAGHADPRKAGKAIPFQHLFTPQTETTAHYWFGTSYPLWMGDEARQRAESDIRYLRQPFETEDLPMLEAQQQTMGGASFWDLKPILLPGDAAAVRARRVLDALIRNELQAARDAAAPAVA